MAYKSRKRAGAYYARRPVAEQPPAVQQASEQPHDARPSEIGDNSAEPSSPPSAESPPASFTWKDQREI